LPSISISLKAARDRKLEIHPLAIRALIRHGRRAEALRGDAEANELFIRVTPDEAQRLRDAGFDFYDWGPGEARLVTSWDSDPGHVDALANAIAGL